MSCISPGAQASRARGPVPRPREPGKSKQPAADEVTRKVLLTDLGLALLPALADLLQDGQHDLAKRFLEAKRSQALVEHRVGGGFVPAADRRKQAGGEILEHSLRRALVLECCPGGLRGRKALLDPGSHPLHPRSVGRRVEPKAARRANRPRQPVPRLPRAQ